MRGQRYSQYASRGGRQGEIGLPLLADPGGRGAGEDGGQSRPAGQHVAVRRVLQVQFPHVREDGLHLELCDQLLGSERSQESATWDYILMPKSDRFLI